jgi:hypothetical protein
MPPKKERKKEKKKKPTKLRKEVLSPYPKSQLH